MAAIVGEPKNPAEKFGVPVTLASRRGALELLSRLLERASVDRTRWIGFLNANNFNRAMIDPAYRAALDGADAVYVDGVAMRTAARIVGVPVKENLPGTDLVPDLMTLTAPRGYGCFLLGDTQRDVELAARHVERCFPGWRVVGAMTGYLRSPDAEERAVRSIAAAAPDLLLIGMGTPEQERFIDRHAAALRVRLAICVGGLFGYWSRKLARAPRVVRALRLEWLWILAQQPHKWRRYTIGTARFFSTIVRMRLARDRAGSGA